MSSPFHIVLIIGSVRENRQGIKVARFLENRVKGRGWDVDVVDLKETPLPMLDMRFKDYAPGTVPPLIQNLHDRFVAADGFLLVSPEYNRSTSAALKNVLDHFGSKEFGHKPVAIATYSDGGFGGVRAMEHLRLISIDLGMVPLKPGFSVSKILETFPQGPEPAADVAAAIEKQVGTFLDAFAWMLAVLKQGREKEKA